MAGARTTSVALAPEVSKSPSGDAKRSGEERSTDHVCGSGSARPALMPWRCCTPTGLRTPQHAAESRGTDHRGDGAGPCEVREASQSLLCPVKSNARVALLAKTMGEARLRSKAGAQRAATRPEEGRSTKRVQGCRQVRKRDERRKPESPRFIVLSTCT